jgi:Fe/S biogenesis protein NfuA
MLGWFRRKDSVQAHAAAPAVTLAAPLPTVHFTVAAQQQLAVVIGRQAEPAALRIFVKNPGMAPPQYDMALEPARTRRAGDTAIDIAGLTVLVDAQSMAAVDGATVDFRNDPLQPGFLVEAPAPPPVEIPDGALSLDPADPFVAQVQSVLEHQVNPAIASHGGHAHLVGVKDDVVFVAMGGGCQGCGMAAVTLKQGIEQALKQALPRIRAVVDATDHAQGEHPYFASDHGAQSPLHQHASA